MLQPDQGGEEPAGFLRVDVAAGQTVGVAPGGVRGAALLAGSTNPKSIAACLHVTRVTVREPVPPLVSTSSMPFPEAGEPGLDGDLPVGTEGGVDPGDDRRRRSRPRRPLTSKLYPRCAVTVKSASPSGSVATPRP